MLNLKKMSSRYATRCAIVPRRDHGCEPFLHSAFMISAAERVTRFSPLGKARVSIFSFAFGQQAVRSHVQKLRIRPRATSRPRLTDSRTAAGDHKLRRGCGIERPWRAHLNPAATGRCAPGRSPLTTHSCDVMPLTADVGLQPHHQSPAVPYKQRASRSTWSQ